MTKSPRILVIGYCYPPTASPEAFVTAKLLRNIPECEIDVLTLEDGLVSDYCDLEMGRYAEGINGKVIKVTPSWLTKKLCRIPRLPLRPDRWLLANRITKKQALKLDPASYDCIVTRSQYHSAHLVGLSLKRKFPHLPWIACFSDPWSGSDHQQSVPLFSRYSKLQENRVLKNADFLVFPTAGLLQHMTKGTKDLTKKSTVIPHCYDVELYGEREASIASSAKVDQTELQWRIFGSFYGNRQPDILIRALSLLQVPNNKKLQIEIYGAFHEKYREFEQFNQTHANCKIAHMGQIPHKSALRIMQKSDLLIVIDSTELSESFYLPSKIIDYFGSGTSILAICKQGTVEEITTSRNQHVANIDDVNSITSAMFNILNQHKRTPTHNSSDKTYAATEVGKNFLSLIKRNSKKND
ncbi:hypothetical protein [uncultured Thalassospira sp.]|uniref:hypothetical protein n=1 Tax=uncultured Thalassospira sp. TaxID=404382 RepID=UPI002583A1BA|nr:hypothetical protein [uncultured Thalassospira sp.]